MEKQNIKTIRKSLLKIFHMHNKMLLNQRYREMHSLQV